MNDGSEKINAAYLALFGPRKIIFGVGVPLAVLLFQPPTIGTSDENFSSIAFPFLRHIRSIEVRIIFFEFGFSPLGVAQDFVCAVAGTHFRELFAEHPICLALKVVDIEGWFSAAA